jgi:tetratricopeptide (TPR) repeat protein
LATNKDKLLESAQKNLKKKQVARAIKDYAKIVEIDPADIRSRQKLAELYVRTSKNADAFEQYEAVAKYYSSNGFYLKAIAIYKQMQRLDPSQMSLFNRLAELNEKQGLIGNAMAEYRNLSNYYERNGMIADAIKTFEKMKELDTANLNVRVKLAEIYALNKREDEGLAEFEGVLEILGAKNEFDKILKLYKIFLPLFPNNKKLQMGLALTLYEKGELAKGIAILSNQLRENPGNPDILRLLARGYDDLQEWPKAQRAYQQLLGLDPSDLDIREALIRCNISSGHYLQALSELEDWKDIFFKSDRIDSLKVHYETLKGVLPQNQQVIQTLDSIYELTGDGEKLLDIMAEIKPSPREALTEETLSDSLLGTADEDIDAPTIDLGFEDEMIEFAVDTEEDRVFAVPAEESDFDLQLEPLDDLDVDEDESAEGFMEFNLSDSLGLEAAVEDDLDFSFDLDADEVGIAPLADGQHDLSADLEEAEFYVQQGLYADAEKLCRAILTYAPDSVACQQKLAEIMPYLGSAAESSSGLQNLAAEIINDDFSDFIDLSDSASAVTTTTAAKKVFRTDVDEQIAADDMESHYNLGIAYREMGLLDDAISEFAKGQKDPARFVDCQTLQGLCFSDQGDFVNAEKKFRLALDSEHLEENQRLNLGYELGSLYERSEQRADAYSCYLAVFEQDSSYRDVKEKVSALQAEFGDEVATQKPIEENKERISFL